MKILSKVVALLPAVTLLLTAGQAFAAAPFHIGVYTETVSQFEDDLRGAEALMKEYGSVAEGGYIKHITFPDDFMSQQETVISNLVALADDPLMKVVVTCSSIPGIAEAYTRIRAKRPDILLFAAAPQEDPLVISQAADLVVDTDFVSRGYILAWIAKNMGAKTYVHVSFPRHMAMETTVRRYNVMKEACKDLGIKCVFETAPDPLSDVGVSGAQQYILEKVPAWIKKYGPNGERVAFFTTNGAQAEPMIKRVAESKAGVFPESDFPSPLMGYPGALGLSLTAEKGNFPAIVKKINDALVAKGAGGRLGTWSYSCGFSFVEGLAELGKRVVEGKAKVTNSKDIFAALGKYTPGAKWNGTFYTDLSTGAKSKNMMLVYMDTYVFGKGYLRTTDLKIPGKYYTIK